MERLVALHFSPVAGELRIDAYRDEYTSEGSISLVYRDGAHEIKRVRYFNGYPDALGPSFWFSNFKVLLAEVAEEYAGGWGAKDIKPYRDKFIQNWLQLVEREDFDEENWLDAREVKI